MNTPARYSPDVERVAEDEPQVHAELVEQLLKISRITFEDGGKPLRSVHAKSHGVLEGTLTVREGLPEPLAQGLFAKPGSFRAVVRFSTSPGDMLPDSVSTPRGLAMKLFDVVGERLPDADDQGTQDFLFVTGKAFSAPDAASFVKTLKLLAATTDRVPDLKVALSRVLRGAEAALEAVGGESAALKGLGRLSAHSYPERKLLQPGADALWRLHRQDRRISR